MGRIINNKKSRDLIIEDFLQSICLRNYVLVISPEVILKSEIANGNPHQYIEEEFINWLDETGRNSEIQQGLTSRSKLVQEFLNEGWSWDIDEISESVSSLIGTKFFPIILYTGYDSYLEALMEKVYNRKPNIVNISDESTLHDKPEGPMLIYVFGKAQSDYKYAFNEDDRMSHLCRWLDSATKPKKLLEYIKNKRILAIGGSFENWYFRFFWYSLRQTLDTNDRNGDVAINIDDPNGNLKKYMIRTSVKDQLKENQIKESGTRGVRKFIEILSDKLCNPDETMRNLMYISNRKMNGIFISYAHDDYPVAIQIFRALRDHGYPVWIDNKELHAGDEYMKDIREAICRCKIFMPIISGNCFVDGYRDRFFYKDEWTSMLADNKECKIVGVALYGFDIRRDTEKLPERFQNKTIADWGNDGIDGLIAAIKKQYNEDE